MEESSDVMIALDRHFLPRLTRSYDDFNILFRPLRIETFICIFNLFHNVTYSLP